MTGNYHQSHLKLKDKRVQLITEKERKRRIQEFFNINKVVIKKFLTFKYQ